MNESIENGSSFSNLTIVLADDDIDDRRFAIDAFNDAGYAGEILEVENGKILLDTLQTMTDNLPRLLVIDLNMPHLNGYEVKERLNRDEQLSKIPRIILTTSTQLQEKKKCEALGCIAYYNKPTTLREYDRIAAEIIMLIGD